MPLSLYLDDCADSTTLHGLLQAAGHTVVRPRDAGTTGLPDADHLDYARRHGLVVVTRNPLDFELLHQADPNHPGIFAIYQDNDPTRDMTFRQIVDPGDRIEEAYDTAGLPIAGAFHALNHWRF